MNTMKTRQEMKMIAKEAMLQNRGQCIGAYLIFTITSVVLSVLTAGFGTFLMMPVLMVALSGFFTKNFLGMKPRVGDMFESIFENFLRKTGAILLMSLLISLGSILIVPGIMLTFAYSMVPYILAEYPNVKAANALKISRKMTNGYKMDIFVTGLSFLGWGLAAAFTFGILDILFVGPYMQSTFGGIYSELKNEALKNGIITENQLMNGESVM